MFPFLSYFSSLFVAVRMCARFLVYLYESTPCISYTYFLYSKLGLNCVYIYIFFLLLFCFVFFLIVFVVLVLGCVVCA